MKGLVVELKDLQELCGRGTVSPEAQKIIDRHAAEIKAHFKKDGWDLDASYYATEIAKDILGFEPLLALLASLKNVYLVADSNGYVFRKKESKKMDKNKVRRAPEYVKNKKKEEQAKKKAAKKPVTTRATQSRKRAKDADV